MIHKGLIYLTLLGFSCTTQASLPQEARAPGGVCLISLPTQGAKTIQVHYRDKPVLIVPHPAQADNVVAIIGIPLRVSLGTQHVLVQRGTQAEKISFEVAGREYPSEDLQLADRSRSHPPQSVHGRIIKEAAEIRATYDKWSAQPPEHLTFQLPVQGRFSSPFGMLRKFNGKRASQHSGLDIAAPRGTAVLAPAAGRVARVGDYYFSGNTVFVEHGQGFITSYSHLDSIAVTAGQKVSPGDKLGTVGNTGRATGPHLHWSVSLNGVRVDPALFITPKT